MDDFVIMPNHIHFILIIDNDIFIANDDVRTTTKSVAKNVGVGSSDQSGKINYTNKGGKTTPLLTLGNIIGYYKYQTTKEYNKMHNKGFNKLWQRNYYEHIIRDDKELYEIRTIYKIIH